MKISLSVPMVTLLLICTVAIALDIPTVKAYEPIYIRADGSIDPPTAAISTADNVTYTFTDHIYDTIVVQRNNIVLDGAGYTLEGAGKETQRETGIYLSGRTNVTVTKTHITNFVHGLRLSGSSYNIVSDNIIANSNLYGLEFRNSHYNTFTGNTFINNGLYNMAETLASYQNLVENNTVNGKPLVYLEGVADYNVGDAGQVILVNCTGIRVESLNLSRASVGVQLIETTNTVIAGNTITNNYFGITSYRFSTNNTVSGNTIANNLYGIVLDSSSNNNISKNTITNNLGGVGLDYSSLNTVAGNTITANSVLGISLSYSSFNTVSGNNITDSSNYGVVVEWSSDNLFCHNNFVNNPTHAVVLSSGYVNSWDDGYPAGGNYWSGFADVDSYKGSYQNATGSDGVWDHAYDIDADNRDRYPLTQPFGWFLAGDVDGDWDVDIFDIVSIAGVYGVQYLDLRYDRQCDLDLDGDIDIFDLVGAAINYGKQSK